MTQEKQNREKEFDKKFGFERNIYAQNFKDSIKLFISQKINQERKEERKRIINIVKKSKKENMSHACKAMNCSDPICGHSRCIEWMYTDLLHNLKLLKSDKK